MGKLTSLVGDELLDLNNLFVTEIDYIRKNK